jgi:hypothetical protein
MAPSLSFEELRYAVLLVSLVRPVYPASPADASLASLYQCEATRLVGAGKPACICCYLRLVAQ